MTWLIQRPGSRPRINVLPGFDPYVGNVREIRRLLGQLGVDVTVLGDHSDTLDSPADGDYQLYPGGTPLAAVTAAPGAVASLPLQAFSTRRTRELIRDTWGQPVLEVAPPIGIRNTDAMLMAVAEATGTEIPAEVTAERGRVIDAITDSHPYVHGKRVAVAGDPDLVLGCCRSCSSSVPSPRTSCAPRATPTSSGRPTTSCTPRPMGRRPRSGLGRTPGTCGPWCSPSRWT